MARAASSKERSYLVRFGEGFASWSGSVKARPGCDYRAPPRNLEELEMPPTCTLPSLAWDSESGKMHRDSLLHFQNGVFSNVKFHEGTGKMQGVSHNWLVLSFYIYHNQHPTNSTLPAHAIASLKGFMTAIKDHAVDVQFPQTSFQPRRFMAFDAIRKRSTKAEMKLNDACRSLHHQGDRSNSATPAVRSRAPPVAGKKSRPSATKAALRAQALKTPLSTRVAVRLYGGRQFCNGCSKVNVMRLLSPTRSWTITEIQRRFGSSHQYAKAWMEIAEHMTMTVVAGLCIANVTSASVKKLVMQRAGTIARGAGVYMCLNYVRINYAGSLKSLLATMYADRPNTAAGIMEIFGTRHTIENAYGDMTAALRDPKTSRIIAEMGRFKYPKLLPKAIMQEAERSGLSQQWWWAAIGYANGPKPSLSSRWVAVPNRNDDEGSYTMVSAEMWNVLDAIRCGWQVNIGLAPDFDPKRLRPRPGANGIAPVHASYEPCVISEPFPEVLCAEYTTWWTLAREMENRKMAANVADPAKFAPLNLTGSWMKATEGVTITIPGCKELTVKMGQCFQDLCKLAIVYKLANFKIDLAIYADFVPYPEQVQATVQEQARQHQRKIKDTLEDSVEGALFADDKGIATAERIFQDVHSRA